MNIKALCSVCGVCLCDVVLRFKKSVSEERKKLWALLPKQSVSSIIYMDRVVLHLFKNLLIRQALVV